MASEPGTKGVDLASADDVDELVEAVIQRLDPGTVIDNKIILSRRQLLAIAGGGLSAGALATLGVTDAEAQSAVGQIGTDTDRVDVYGASGDFTSLEADTLNGIAEDPHGNSTHSTDMVEDATNTGNAPYEIQKDGSDGTGVINFKTS